jgi:hypothetical protein
LEYGTTAAKFPPHTLENITTPMKNTFKSAIIAAAIAASLPLVSQATEFRDADLWNTTIAASGGFASDFNIVTLDGSGDTFTVASPPYNTTTQNGNKTYTSQAGYLPGHTVTDGTVNFWFRGTQNDSFIITVGLSTLLTTSNGGPVSFKSDDLNVTLIADLEADGKINYTILNGFASAITLDYALLTANAPDGGTTVLLLGAALTGLGMLRRRFAA